MQNQNRDVADRPDTGSHPPLSTSKTIGYDSAQKSGYDTEKQEPETRRTTNEVDANATAPHRERQENERAASTEDSSKSENERSVPGYKGASDEQDNFAGPIPMD